MHLEEIGVWRSLVGLERSFQRSFRTRQPDGPPGSVELDSCMSRSLSCFNAPVCFKLRFENIKTFYWKASWKSRKMGYWWRRNFLMKPFNKKLQLRIAGKTGGASLDNWKLLIWNDRIIWIFLKMSGSGVSLGFNSMNRTRFRFFSASLKVFHSPHIFHSCHESNLQKASSSLLNRPSRYSKMWAKVEIRNAY